METRSFEELFTQCATAQRELEELAQLATLSDAAIQEVVLRRGGWPHGVNYWAQRLAAVGDLAAARAACHEAVVAVRRHHADAEAELERLREGPLPLPGSRAHDALVERVRRIEGELPALRTLVERVETDERVDLAPLQARGQQARARLGATLKMLMAERAVSEASDCAQRYRFHAVEVLKPLEEYGSFARTVDSIVGSPVPGPQIVFAAAEAWRLVGRGEPARLGPLETASSGGDTR